MVDTSMSRVGMFMVTTVESSTWKSAFGGDGIP